MARYVPDVLTHRWVIISPGRIARPHEKNKVAKSDESKHRHTHTSPFCEGNEQQTHPEVLRYGGGEPNRPGWKLRVVPNKYPITDFHEVVIHSPDCDFDIEEFDQKQAHLVIRAYHERFNYYKEKGQVLIFCNHGRQAGASIDHPHSQIVVLPFQINLDSLSREPLNNVVAEKKYFYVYCPDFSQWPYELWIVPKREKTPFGSMNEEELEELTTILQKSLLRLKHIYDKYGISDLPFSYNYYIYPKREWYLRIIPRFVHRAGFELGTGLSVNIVDPTHAAREFEGKI